jgi:hypothetical protein
VININNLCKVIEVGAMIRKDKIYFRIKVKRYLWYFIMKLHMSGVRRITLRVMQKIRTF